MRNQPFTFSGTPQDGTLSDGLLVINGGKIQVARNTIEGVTQVGSSWGKIYSIELRVIEIKAIKIVFRYEIVINGRADRLGGNWYFFFTDETSDTYSLSILNPITADHTVKFGSVAPNIVKVRWAKTP
jgi:hypothetical protein